MNTVGERLEFLRKQKGKSYQALADLIGGISGDAIRKAIQRNNVKDFYVNIISDKLRINKEWLISGQGEMNLSYEYNDLQHFSKEDILDYIIMYIDDFTSNPKIDALYRILKSKNNQDSLENMHDKIDELTKLVDELKKK
ncbi:hypothetical protein BTO06_09995 [Tenacibaculum sp. SZ-18]|uniref:hypothetical protein n=1 Tax=Tenacibaculum TaxID=104267 RepID=UPI000C2D0E1C|nr:hypothetical protein [Tenacibaculum sp. SZ-18]AUC15452.1 hypothetical protein BTO06_09995 [Tenacibaculum sp. SZ-18]